MIYFQDDQLNLSANKFEDSGFKSFKLEDADESASSTTTSLASNALHLDQQASQSSPRHIWAECKDIMIKYANKIEDFKTLSSMDQQKLIEASWVEVVSLYTAYHLANR